MTEFPIERIKDFVKNNDGKWIPRHDIALSLLGQFIEELEIIDNQNVVVTYNNFTRVEQAKTLAKSCDVWELRED